MYMNIMRSLKGYNECFIMYKGNSNCNSNSNNNNNNNNNNSNNNGNSHSGWYDP